MPSRIDEIDERTVEAFHAGRFAGARENYEKLATIQAPTLLMPGDQGPADAALGHAAAARNRRRQVHIDSERVNEYFRLRTAVFTLAKLAAA